MRVSARESAQYLVSLKFKSSELEVNSMDQTEAKVNVCLMKGHAKGVVRIAGGEHDELVSIFNDPSSSCLG